MEKEIENGAEEAVAERKKAGWQRRAVRLELAVICFLISLPLVALLFGGQRSSLALSPPERAAVIEGKASQNVHSATSAEPQDKLLGGLLSPNFDEQSCSSRFESSLFRRPSPFSPSSYLIQKLRKYEAYHKKCGPGTELYRKAVQQLKSGRNVEQTECKYVVWVPINGIGNRMLSLVSTFLYALLTDRVLLTDVTKESENLFCEPFPASSWVVPSNFPIKDMSKIDMGAPQSYLNLRDSMVIGNNANVSGDSLPPFVFLPLVSYLFRDNNIFCGYDKIALEKFNWMIVKSDSYFVPAIFLMPMYEDELGRLFPQKESVFHHLGRYLFHPTNRVWGMIRRYYKAYLAKADEKIGIQIRVFPGAPIPFENMYEQVLECTRNENLLPKTSRKESRNSSSNATRILVAVQVTSLFSGYYEKIKTKYYESPTANGEIVAVYQPSHEEEQHSEVQNHNRKALAEIYLLSFSDKIVTTAWSTFGYIAHGLTGLRPWILLRPGRMQKTAEPPCVRSTSVEPCMHFPPRVDCEDRKQVVDVGTVVPYVRHCEDVNFGVKLFS